MMIIWNEQLQKQLKKYLGHKKVIRNLLTLREEFEQFYDGCKPFLIF